MGCKKKKNKHIQTNLSSAHQWKNCWFSIWTMNILGPILSSHGLTALNPGFTVCVWGDESLGRLQRALFRFVLGAASASVSSPLTSAPECFSVYGLYSTSPRALSSAPGECDRVCQRCFFFSSEEPVNTSFVSTFLKERARNTNKPCGRHTVMHPAEIPNGKRRKNNHAVLS